jgi:hypothetical protein
MIWRVYDESRNGRRLIGTYRRLEDASRAVKRAVWCGVIVEGRQR